MRVRVNLNILLFPFRNIGFLGATGDIVAHSLKLLHQQNLLVHKDEIILPNILIDMNHSRKLYDRSLKVYILIMLGKFHIFNICQSRYTHKASPAKKKDKIFNETLFEKLY